MIGLLLLSGTFLLVGFTAVRAVREWRRSDLADQARDDWDTAVTDALRLAACPWLWCWAAALCFQ